MEILNTCPEWTQAKRDEAGNCINAADPVKWSGEAPPPAVGDRIVIAINRCGPAIVTGYFVDSGWLGLAVEMTDPPEWFIKQNGDDRSGFVFGAEIE